MSAAEAVSTPSAPSYRSLSLWWDTLPAGLAGPGRGPLGGDTDADVAIVGAGYTGLWTAYYLAKADPTLRIVIVERETAGFGASGRNGGWCSALFPASWDKIARGSSRSEAIRMQRAMFGAVDETGRVAEAEKLDVHWAKGGTLGLARSATQEARARAEIEHARSWGFGADDYRWLSATEVAEHAVSTEVRGGTFTPHTAAIHPARLARGLAHTVERLGVRIFEQTAALALEPGVVRTPHGVVRAERVIRATEGYTPSLPGYRRAVVPVYSLMLATEPLPASFWDVVGWGGHETITDGRHLYIYAMRTEDDRIALGGRGAPYHFNSKVSEEYEQVPRVHAVLERTLKQLFPAAKDARITHRWGGSVAIPRDWFPSVGLDKGRGYAWAGGYVGDGVAASNLAGRTLADLITGADTEIVRLPWVNHLSPKWEPEPLRWLGIRTSLAVFASADRKEQKTGKPARRAEVMQKILPV